MFKEFYLFKNITKFKQGGKSDLFGSNLKRWFKYVQTPTHFASYHGKNYCLFIPLKSVYFFFFTAKHIILKLFYFYYFYSTFMDMICFGEKIRSEGFSFCNKFELLTCNRTVFFGCLLPLLNDGRIYLSVFTNNHSTLHQLIKQIPESGISFFFFKVSP